MASSSADVPYNHPTDNVLFGQNVIEKISDTCLGQDGKRYYQVKWRDSWEPEERLMAACEGALQEFWKEYYTNVEKEIRKQVVNSSKVVQISNTSQIVNTPLPVKSDEGNKDVTVNAIEIIPNENSELGVNIHSEPTDNPQSNPVVTATNTISAEEAMVLSGVQVSEKVIGNFPEQSATVAYYAVQDNENGEEGTKESESEANMQDQLNNQTELLKQIINSTTGFASDKWDANKAPPNRRTLTSITADTLNTKNVGAPDADARFHCDICMKTFVSKRNVQRHMLSHTGEKPWMCEFCFKRFRQKPHLEQHVNIHKGIKNSVCNICGKAFNHRSNLVTHMATHSDLRPHICSLCGETFKLKHTLAKHMMVHTKQDIDKRHQCQICKRSFRDKSYLAEHETIHAKDKPWKCDICNKAFSFKRRYQMHLEVHQSKDGGEEYVCHFCPKRFKGKIYLQKHLERHEKRRRKRKKKVVDSAPADSSHLLITSTEGEGQSFITETATEEYALETNEDMELTIPDDDDEGDDIEEGEEEEEDLGIEEGEKFEGEGEVLHIDAGSTGAEGDMVVTNMLPIDGLEDATYVALAQLTQAAIESAPMDESGNVILMSYEDIQKSMQQQDVQYEIQVSQPPLHIDSDVLASNEMTSHMHTNIQSKDLNSFQPNQPIELKNEPVQCNVHVFTTSHNNELHVMQSRDKITPISE